MHPALTQTLGAPVEDAAGGRYLLPVLISARPVSLDYTAQLE